MSKIFLLILMSLWLIGEEYAGDSNTSSKMGAFVPNGILTDIDYDRFWKEFSVTGNVRTNCGVDDLNDGLVGFDSYMIEVAKISETTREKWRLEFLQTNLQVGDQYKNLLETGVSRKEENAGRLYNHIFEFPLFSMIFQDQFNGAFCFEQGTTGIIYMSELDPSAGIDLYRLKMMPFVASMLTEQGLINSIASCLATEAYEKLDAGEKRKGKGKIYKDLMDNFFYVMGCKGLIPIGDYSNNVDPLAASYNVAAGNIHFLTTTSPVLKQTVRSVLNQYSDERWCSPKEGPIPMIMSQYAAQIVRPRVGKVMELGVTPPESTFLKNDATTGDNTVLLIWQRRDYSMFAYKCGKRDQ
jgi:hypothetical protein